MLTLLKTLCHDSRYLAGQHQSIEMLKVAMICNLNDTILLNAGVVKSKLSVLRKGSMVIREIERGRWLNIRLTKEILHTERDLPHTLIQP